MKEIWKEIEEYEGLYWVSNIGRVKSKRKILQPIKGEYLKVGLSKNGIQKTLTIHRLVAQTFIKNKNNYNFVNHKDENKYNNFVNNLEWCTNKYNCNYGKRNIELSKNLSKYKIIQKNKQNNIIRIWDNMWEITHKTNFKKSNIQKCCQKKQNTAYNFKWEYSTL